MGYYENQKITLCTELGTLCQAGFPEPYTHLIAQLLDETGTIIVPFFRLVYEEDREVKQL